MSRPNGIRESRWRLAEPVPAGVLRKLSHLPPVMLQVLYNRKLQDEAQIQAFIDGRYLDSTDPFLLSGMEDAVRRIRHAIENDQVIAVYGDFDADGVTSTVLLTQALRRLGLPRTQVRPYIPDRVDEGYGLNEEALSKLKKMGAELVITVDCGVRSVREVEHANSIGLDVIVTDHHSIGRAMPPAVAVVNPKREDSGYPEKWLAGVGLAYKLAQALAQSMPQRAAYEPEDFLDLVAVGTVADLAPLQGENRKLVKDGLDVLNLMKRPGLAVLARVASLPEKRLTAESIAFGLGPRINAAGRLQHAYTAAKLLAAPDVEMAQHLAQELNRLNKERQRLTRELSERAETMVNPADHVIIAADEEFKSGIVGLVASRLAEKNYRPAIVLESGPEESRGSCRSIPEFHITEALDELADLLVRHGGHAQAAGFTVRNEDLAEFSERMQDIARRKLENLDLKPGLDIDAEVSFVDIDWALYGHLRDLEPTGQDNAPPIFVSQNVQVMSSRAVGQDGGHLQLHLADSDDANTQRIMPAIAFRQGAWADCLPPRIDVAYTVNSNEWNGRRNLQLIVQEIRPAQS